mmetsp:Transcript_39462/g.81951  ORF Transcript_39462/g.81951 Transcript_39462/m.81951 type:complete len:138 (+) Transcript_39462:334-747(+)
MRDVTCGTDMYSFCDEWAQKEQVITLWGAFVVVIGHFFLIAASAMAAIHNRSAQRGIALLPSRKEYAAGLSLAAQRIDVNDDGAGAGPSKEKTEDVQMDEDFMEVVDQSSSQRKRLSRCINSRYSYSCNRTEAKKPI